MTQREGKKGAGTVEELYGARQSHRPGQSAALGTERTGGREGKREGEKVGGGEPAGVRVLVPPPCRAPGFGPATLWLRSARKQSYRCRRVSLPRRAAPSVAGPRGGKKREGVGKGDSRRGGLKEEKGAGWEGEGTTTTLLEGVFVCEVKKKGAGCLRLVSFGMRGFLGKIRTRPFRITWPIFTGRFSKSKPPRRLLS